MRLCEPYTLGSKNILKRVTFEYSSTQEDWSDVPGWVPDFPWSSGDVVDHGFVFGLIFDLTKATSGPAKDLTDTMESMAEKEEDGDEGSAASDEVGRCNTNNNPGLLKESTAPRFHQSLMMIVKRVYYIYHRGALLST